MSKEKVVDEKSESLKIKKKPKKLANKTDRDWETWGSWSYLW